MPKKIKEQLSNKASATWMVKEDRAIQPATVALIQLFLNLGLDFKPWQACWAYWILDM